MRVAVDATAIPAQRVGVGVYVVGILRHIPRDIDVHVFVRRDQASELATLLPDAMLHPVDVGARPLRIAWMHSVLPMRLRHLAPHVFWGPHYELPPRLRCPAVVTFHDPTFFSHPEVHERAKVAYFRRAARSSISRAVRVIAVSEYAKRGAIEHAGARAERIDVIAEGIDLDRFRPATDPTPYDTPYVFFVGALAPHKNVPALVAAFDMLDGPHELVIAGPRAWGAAAADDAIAAARRRNVIRVLGFISDEDKVARLQHASVFVYPSLFEGFGLPVLEAMACGTPAITTSGSAPEEFASDAAVLVPPGDVGALRDALHRVLTDSELAATLKREGPVRAQRFSWAAAANATVDTWRRAAESA